MAGAGYIEVSESSSSAPTTPESVALRDLKSVYFDDKNGRNLENFSRYLVRVFVIFRRFFGKFLERH